MDYLTKLLGLHKLVLDNRFYAAILAGLAGWLSETGYTGLEELPPVAYGIVAIVLIITYGWREPESLLSSARFGALVIALLAAGVALATGQRWDVVNDLPLDQVTNVILLAVSIIISLMKRDAGESSSSP